ncbi:MAG TPA: HNH endonuclease family protein [Pseudonocardia sp.]
MTPIPARTAALVLLAALTAGCAGTGGSWPPPAVTAAPSTAPAGPTSATGDPDAAPGVAPSTDAAAALATLPVKGRAPLTGYSRTLFGPAWTDTDRNGCDQRNQVLARDMTGERFKARTRGCVVASGHLLDPYTGKEIDFRRGDKTSSAVQIDHVVALGDAWRTGAQQLDAATLLRFANDPLNLLAVDGPTNQGKGDSDAASWLPPSRGYRCSYVSRQVAVKQRYRLWVTPAERTAIAGVLAGCPGQRLPTEAPDAVG